MGERDRGVRGMLHALRLLVNGCAACRDVIDCKETGMVACKDMSAGVTAVKPIALR